MSAGHNKYVLQPSRYKVLCLQSTTNMSSSPVGTRYCVYSPQQICPPAQYIQGIVSTGHNKYILQPSTYKVLCLQSTTNTSTGLEDIFVMACRHKTLYYRAGGHIVRRSTCIHTLTGTRYLKGLRPQLRVKNRALQITL